MLKPVFGWILVAAVAGGGSCAFLAAQTGSSAPRKDAPEKDPDRASEIELSDDRDVEILEAGRNAGEPQGATRRSKVGIFDFYGELYTRYKDREVKETDEETHKRGFVTTTAGKVEATLLDRERSDIKGEFRFRRNFDSRPDSTDWWDFDLTFEYKDRRNGFTSNFYRTPNKLAFFRKDVPVTRDISGVELSYTRRLSRKLRLRGTQDFSREIYSDAKERDFMRYRTRVDIKYRFHRLLYPGIGLQFDTKLANSKNFNREEVAPVFLLSSRFGDRAILSATYRYRLRDYTTEDDGMSNYRREDRGPTLFFASYLRLKGNVWLRVFGSLERFDTRKQGRDRDFNKNELGMGLRYYFP